MKSPASIRDDPFLARLIFGVRHFFWGIGLKFGLSVIHLCRIPFGPNFNGYGRQTPESDSYRNNGNTPLCVWSGLNFYFSFPRISGRRLFCPTRCFQTVPLMET
jgi:hypothetical protein